MRFLALFKCIPRHHIDTVSIHSEIVLVVSHILKMGQYVAFTVSATGWLYAAVVLSYVAWNGLKQTESLWTFVRKCLSRTCRAVAAREAHFGNFRAYKGIANWLACGLAFALVTVVENKRSFTFSSWNRRCSIMKFKLEKSSLKIDSLFNHFSPIASL